MIPQHVEAKSKFLRLARTLLCFPARKQNALSPSPLDTLINDLVVTAAVVLFSAVIGVIAGGLLQRFGKPFAQSFQGLSRAWNSSARPIHVLIVEDNPNSRETLKKYLMRRDYRVAAAGNLQTGVKFLRKSRFDAIISDIALPDGTGYTLINEARRLGMHALGIAVSGYPYPSNVEEAGVTGFDYHLTKPVDCDHLCFLLKKQPVRRLKVG